MPNSQSLSLFKRAQTNLFKKPFSTLQINWVEVAALDSEFKKQIGTVTDAKTSEKILSIIKNAGQEFPCLTCASRDECGSFKWFTKWFGTDFKVDPE